MMVFWIGVGVVAVGAVVAFVALAEIGRAEYPDWDRDEDSQWKPRAKR